MAKFQTAPDTILRSIPPSLPADIQDVLRQPGTYALELTDALKLPLGNSTWKGPQARLVAVLGGADGVRLDVVPLAPVVRVDPLTPADSPPPDNVYVYLVRFLSDDLNGKCYGGTMLEGRLSADCRWGPKGGRFTEPLRVTFLPEQPVSGAIARIPPGGGEVFVNALINECLRQGMTIPDQIAYTLATAEHEGGLGQPVRESWGAPAAHTVTTDEAWRRNGDTVSAYYPYYGRGYVQITLKGNYASHGRRLGLPLVDDPDLALHRDLAINVLIHGMIHSFTGAQLSTFINGRDPPDFVNARRVVNRLVAAERIATLARGYQTRVQDRLAALGR